MKILLSVAAILNEAHCMNRTSYPNYMCAIKSHFIVAMPLIVRCVMSTATCMYMYSTYECPVLTLVWSWQGVQWN